MLTAIGCVEPSSQSAAIVRTCFSVSFLVAMTFCTAKFPFVMVPVLSIMTALTSFNASIATPPLKRIPLLDPAPIPEKKANGTLNTSAHGQLITRNVIAV